MSALNDCLERWASPISDTEDEKVTNSVEMIKKSILDSDALNNKDIDVFIQGSYANETNIKSESDVDICVMLNNPFYTNYPAGKNRDNYGHSVATYKFDDYYNDVLKALESKFNYDEITKGNKSIKIVGNTYRVNADVVPCLLLRDYVNSKKPNGYVEGIEFISRDKEFIINYPQEHLKNGKSKNIITNHFYKKIVRILKHIKYELEDSHNLLNNNVSSFIIECLVYNVPNSYFTQSVDLTTKTKRVLKYIYDAAQNNEIDNWKEVNEIIPIFPNKNCVKQDVSGFVSELWNYLESIRDE